jgi:hypothetical protein
MSNTFNGGFTDLIEACEIFRKYADPQFPTHCEHDVMTVCSIDPGTVSSSDKARLEELGFTISNDDDGYFQSFRFGSA